MNLSSRTSSSTSVMNIQTEPPSNQKYYKNYTPLLPEEEKVYIYMIQCVYTFTLLLCDNNMPSVFKVIGMKRPYPFSLDNAPGPPLHTKYPPIVHSIYGQIETTSNTKDTTFNFEPDASNFRFNFNSHHQLLQTLKYKIQIPDLFRVMFSGKGHPVRPRATFSPEISSH